MTKEKMVLIVDKPVDCLECRLYSEYDMECWYLRNAKYYVDERPPYCPLRPLPKKVVDWEERPSWCPLKNTPVKYSARTEMYLIPPNETEERKMQAFGEGYIRGRNDCIDEIIGEEE